MVIDTLQLDIVVNTKNSGASITTVRNSLEKLYKTLEKAQNQDLTKVNDDLAKLTGRLVPLTSALNGLNAADKNLTKLGASFRTFNKRMSEIDAKAMSRKFDLMTKAITPFIDKVSSAREALNSLNSVMSGAKTMSAPKSASETKTVKKTQNTNNNKLVKNLNFGSMVAKLYFIRNITKQLGQDLAKVIQYGIDYEETLNLWQVAMRGNISQAREFVSTMRNAYGISSATLMNYQATFKNMLSALEGLNDEVAYGLSEALTGMALDYASLYNTSIESAMTKFQAVLSGQVRPIRSESGYDITESTIFSLYQELGGTKSVRQLDQMEKRLLRILAVYKQMEGVAIGDLSKTITSSANQLRVMGEQGKEFATWIGVAFNTMVEKSGILVEINAWLFALTAIAKQYAITMGYVEKDYSIKEPIQEANNELNIANKSADALKGKLLGFDKFQVLSTAGVEQTDVDLAAEITKAIQDYKRIINDTDNPAFERSLEILKQIGLELDENGNIVGGFDELIDKVEQIVKAVATISVTILALTNPILAVVAAMDYLYISNQDFRNGLNETLSSVWDTVTPILNEALGFIGDILNAVAPLITDILSPILPLMVPVGKILTDVLTLVTNIVSVLSPIIGMVANLLNILTPILEIVHGITWIVSTVLSGAIWVIFEILTPFLAIIEVIFKIVESIGEVIRSIFQWDWGSLGRNLSKIWKDWESTELSNKLIQMPIVPTWKADGGLATKGSLFYAGEAGPELVTRTSGGGSTIMNMQQLEDAVARGMLRGNMSNQRNQNQKIAVNIGSKTLFEIFVDEARSNGYELVKVR